MKKITGPDNGLHRRLKLALSGELGIDHAENGSALSAQEPMNSLGLAISRVGSGY